jgi:hypothetical protein
MMVLALALGFAIALGILADEFLLGEPSAEMWVMNLVDRSLSTVGPVSLWAYSRNGRQSGHKACMRRRSGSSARASTWRS